MTSKLMGKQWKESSVWSQAKMSAWFTPINSNSFLPRSAIVSTLHLSLFRMLSLLEQFSEVSWHSLPEPGTEVVPAMGVPCGTALTVWQVRIPKTAGAAKMKWGVKIPSYNLLAQCLKRWGKMSICSEAEPLSSCHFKSSFCTTACEYNYSQNFSIKKKQLLKPQNLPINSNEMVHLLPQYLFICQRHEISMPKKGREW